VRGWFLCICLALVVLFGVSPLVHAQSPSVSPMPQSSELDQLIRPAPGGPRTPAVVPAKIASPTAITPVTPRAQTLQLIAVIAACLSAVGVFVVGFVGYHLTRQLRKSAFNVALAQHRIAINEFIHKTRSGGPYADLLKIPAPKKKKFGERAVIFFLHLGLLNLVYDEYKPRRRATERERGRPGKRRPDPVRPETEPAPSKERQKTDLLAAHARWWAQVIWPWYKPREDMQALWTEVVKTKDLFGEDFVSWLQDKMNTPAEPTDWEALKTQMDRHASRHEAQLKELLAIVPECARTLSELFDKGVSDPENRPQDYVATLLAANSFRLCVCVMRLYLSGYPRAAQVVGRTVLEISLWLGQIEKDPVAASLAYLVASADEQLEMGERYRENLPSQVLLEAADEYLVRWNERRAKVERLIRQHGLCPSAVRKKYPRRANVRDVCTDLGLDSGYKTVYAHRSLRAHGRYVSEGEFDAAFSDHQKSFELGPLCTDCAESAAVALHTLIMNLGSASTIIGEPGLESKCRDMQARLLGLLKRIRDDHLCGQ